MAEITMTTKTMETLHPWLCRTEGPRKHCCIYIETNTTLSGFSAELLHKDALHRRSDDGDTLDSKANQVYLEILLNMSKHSGSTKTLRAETLLIHELYILYENTDRTN